MRLYWQKVDRLDGSIPLNLLNIQHQAHNMELLCLEEGHFEEGVFIIDRIRRVSFFIAALISLIREILGDRKK